MNRAVDINSTKYKRRWDTRCELFINTYKQLTSDRIYRRRVAENADDSPYLR